MFQVEDQHQKLIVVDFVQNPPSAGPHPPRARVADKLGGLRRPGIFSKTIYGTLYLRLNGFVESQECPASLIAEYDLIRHQVRL